VANSGRMRPQRCILRNLVRAYVLSSGLNPENLVRAETALDELLDSIPPDDQRDVANQELHWWKLAVLRRRNASEDTLFETFRSIIENMEFTEDNVTKYIYIVLGIVLGYLLIDFTCSAFCSI
jgi:hypothetical protein